MVNRNIIAIIFIILFSANVLALGVNSQYHNSNPLKMQPGETRNIEFVLVHGTEEKTDVRAIASLVKGFEIAEIISEKEFTLSPGTLVEDNKKVALRISIPKDAELGKSYKIELSVTAIPEKEIATVQLNTAYLIDFPVIVGEESSAEAAKPSEKKINIEIVAIIISILIITTIIIVIILLLRKKQEIK